MNSARTIKALLIAAALACCLIEAEALECFETDENGVNVLKRNHTWTYCALVPQSSLGAPGGRTFGMGPVNDWTEAYDATFSQNDDTYKVLTVCILEKYDFSSLSPKNSALMVQPEFLFRCVCNYDRCNSESTFEGYLNTVKRANYV
uniref:Protein sleepless n=1 Tax=Rhabditophanes sp. KR3021 TaxID=114890 RepID=A0AC35TKK8_9BILA